MYSVHVGAICMCICTSMLRMRVYELNNIHGRFVEAGSPDSASFVRNAACTCLNEGTEVDSSGNSDAVFARGSGSSSVIAVIELLIKPVN